MKLVEGATLTNVPIENINVICEYSMFEQPSSDSNMESHLIASGQADINIDNNLPKSLVFDGMRCCKV